MYLCKYVLQLINRHHCQWTVSPSYLVISASGLQHLPNEKGMTIGSYLKKDLIRIEANLRVLNGLNQSDDLKEPMRVFLFPNNLGGTGNYPVASWEVKKVTKHFPITQNIWCRIPIRFRFPTATKVSRENE